MIYSSEINKVCAVCRYAQNTQENNEEQIYCSLYKKNEDRSRQSCRKFVYDIFKKQVRRKRRLKTDFSPEDFTL